MQSDANRPGDSNVKKCLVIWLCLFLHKTLSWDYLYHVLRFLLNQIFLGYFIDLFFSYCYFIWDYIICATMRGTFMVLLLSWHHFHACEQLPHTFDHFCFGFLDLLNDCLRNYRYYYLTGINPSFKLWLFWPLSKVF